MAERPNKFPSPSEIRTGETLPLGGRAVRDADERSTLRMSFSPSVTRQRIVFVAKPDQASFGKQRSLMVPTTLRGPDGGDLTAPPLDMRLDMRLDMDTEVDMPEACPAPVAQPSAAEAVASTPDELLCKPLEPGTAEPIAALSVASSPHAQPPRLLIARLRNIPPNPASQDRRLVLLGVVLLGLCGVGLSYPLQLPAVAWGKFNRYAHVDVAVTAMQGDVRAVHVLAGQHIQVGTPVLTFDDSTLLRERNQLGSALDAALQALAQAQATSQAELAANAAKQALARKGISQRVTEKRGELASLELKRDSLIAAQTQSYVSPLSLAALDDRVDLKRDELRALEAEQTHTEQIPAVPPSAPSAPSANEAGQLSHEVELLGGRQAALERLLEATLVTADRAGMIVDPLPRIGSRVEPQAALYRIIPDGAPPSLVATFSERDASDLERAGSVTLKLRAAAPVRASVLRVTRRAGIQTEAGADQPYCEVELMLLDGVSSKLVAAIEQDGAVQAEHMRQTTLFGLGVEKLRASVFLVVCHISSCARIVSPDDRK